MLYDLVVLLPDSKGPSLALCFLSGKLSMSLFKQMLICAGMFLYNSQDGRTPRQVFMIAREFVRVMITLSIS